MIKMELRNFNTQNEDFDETAATDADMRSRTDRRTVRPLGWVAQESRLEQHMEKALFRHQVKLLSDLIQAKRTQRAPFHDIPPPRLMSSRLSQHSVTIEDKYRNVNNAFHARYFNTVPQTVLNAADRRMEGYPHRVGPPACQRQAEVSNRMKSAHCDIFGPKFCVDCTRIKKRVKSAQDQKVYFPNISTHSKAIVAPEKVERILLWHERDYFHSPSFGSAIYDLSSICKGPDGSGPHVFPESEILERVRSAKKLEAQREAEMAEKEAAPLAPPSSRRNSISQITPFPQNNDMRVTVSFAV